MLAKQFGLQIVAEGVEEKAQADFLRQLAHYCEDDGTNRQKYSANILV